MSCKKVTWNGIEYASISALAKARNRYYTVVRKQIEKGYTSDDDLRSNRPVTINGITYKNTYQASKAIGIQLSSLSDRLKGARVFNGEFKKKNTPRIFPVTIKGKLYSTVLEAMTNLGVTRQRVYQLIKLEKNKND